MNFNRLVRFIPRSSSSSILIGEPVDQSCDVGLDLYNRKEVEVRVFGGDSVLNPGVPTGDTAVIETLLAPLSQAEVGTIRCIGLNYHQHAKEMNLAIPKVPALFLKPPSALANPWPEPTIIPYISQKDACADYESELCVVIGKECKNVSEHEAMDYVLGYTAANDLSSRECQFEQSQWCFSKGFDGSCPIGPAIVSTRLIPDPSKLRIRGLKNGKQLQDCKLDDMIFSIPRIVSFLSQSTTLHPGTLILTGTPAGVGMGCNPKEYLSEGDIFSVEISPHIGTLFSKFKNEE